MHSYTVSLRFTGGALNVSEISRRLGLEPSHFVSASDPAPDGRQRHAFWAYNGHSKDGFQPEWSSLEEGLSFLLRALNSHRTAVLELSRNLEGVWWCGHFQSSFSGGPTLSPELLGEISRSGLPLSIDNYFSEEP